MGDDQVENAKEALKKDWEQTKSDMPGMEGEDTDQDAGDTVREALGKDDKGE